MTASHHTIVDLTFRGEKFLAYEPFPASELGANVRGMEAARRIAVGPPPPAKAAKAAERRAQLAGKAEAPTPASAPSVDLTDAELEAATAPAPSRAAAGKRR